MIATERLILRNWRDTDLDPFAALCADADVMQHLGGPQARLDVAAAMARQRAGAERNGHCFWAVERRGDGALLGFCGLQAGTPPVAALGNVLEIGWRLRRDAWGQGYAREAAAAALAWAWAHTDRAEVLAWTVPANCASWGLMLRLGMRHRSHLDFAHPAFPVGHPLSGHVVYAIDRPARAAAD